jgi:hypothetical protein
VTKKKKKKVKENNKNKRLVCLYEEKNVIFVQCDDKMQFVVLVRFVFFERINKKSKINLKKSKIN